MLNRRLSQCKPDFARKIINSLINKTGLHLISPREMTRGAVGLIAQPRSLPQRSGVITVGKLHRAYPASPRERQARHMRAYLLYLSIRDA